MSKNKNYVPYNLEYFKHTQVSAYVLKTTIKKVYLYTDLEIERLQSGIEEGKSPLDIFSYEHWKTIQERGYEEYSDIRVQRVNHSWKDLIDSKLYTAFRYNGKTLEEIYNRFIELYTTKPSVAQKHYSLFRKALDEYSQVLYDKTKDHTTQNKNRAKDTLYLRKTLANDVCRRRLIDEAIINSTIDRDALLEEALDYGITVPTQTINVSGDVVTFEKRDVQDELLSNSVFEPHSIKTYHPLKSGEKYEIVSMQLKRKDVEFSSKTDEDIALYCAAWIKQNLGDEFLETVDTVNGKVSRRDIRLGLVDEADLIECRDFLGYETGRSVFTTEQGRMRSSKTRWCKDED